MENNSNPRVECIKALVQIERNESYSNLVINDVLKKVTFTPEDKSLFTKIVYGVIANKTFLLWVLKKYVKRPHKQQDWLKYTLMTSLYQIAFLDSIPDYAVVNEGVKYVKKRNYRKASFVNAVLRNIVREKDSIFDVPKEDFLEFLSIRYSYPRWMVEEFSKVTTTNEHLEALLKAMNSSHHTTLRVNTLKSTKEELLRTLKDKGIDVSSVDQYRVAIKFNSSTPLNNIKELDEGKCFVQSLGSILVGEIADPKPGETVIDMCAAPGTKTTHLAQQMGDKGKIYACDVHKHRVNLIKKSCQTAGVNIVEPVLLDSTKACEYFQKRFDLVLLDAPCSGLGVIANKPDIKWNKSKDDLVSIASLQLELIKNGVKLLNPGGVLIYSTCTLTKTENEDIVNYALNIDDTLSLVQQRHVFPDKDNTDGFYIAKIKKRKKGEID
ncbi:16S rRNA (cytosine(967)-C(5))-methyltransferase RsmB [Proteinivorax hydrogeniformans]|uniref:16S rRNA (cytosine(967)-C(5))-methyltransferase n=1 Tax=Proteinivorax hydrogeniformans TaxID=1826727 RepID=A0AAU8HPQ7_9FIRM